MKLIKYTYTFWFGVLYHYRIWILKNRPNYDINNKIRYIFVHSDILYNLFYV